MISRGTFRVDIKKDFPGFQRIKAKWEKFLLSTSKIHLQIEINLRLSLTRTIVLHLPGFNLD